MPSTNTAAKKTTSAKNISIDLIGQVVDNGLSNTFESLKEKVTASIKDNGEQYLTDAVDQLKDAAVGLVGWSKKNPVKTAVAVAAVLAVTAFLVATTNGAATVGKLKSVTALPKAKNLTAVAKKVAKKAVKTVAKVADKKKAKARA